MLPRGDGEWSEWTEKEVIVVIAILVICLQIRFGQPRVKNSVAGTAVATQMLDQFVFLVNNLTA